MTRGKVKFSVDVSQDATDALDLLKTNGMFRSRGAAVDFLTQTFGSGLSRSMLEDLALFASDQAQASHLLALSTDPYDGFWVESYSSDAATWEAMAEHFNMLLKIDEQDSSEPSELAERQE